MHRRLATKSGAALGSAGFFLFPRREPNSLEERLISKSTTDEKNSTDRRKARNKFRYSDVPRIEKHHYCGTGATIAAQAPLLRHRRHCCATGR
jgi:hypothetical protein